MYGALIRTGKTLKRTEARAEAANCEKETFDMSINLQKPDITELKPRITVFGVGGGGCLSLIHI